MSNATAQKIQKRQRRGVIDKFHPRMRPAQKKAIELFRAQVLSGNYKSIEETLLEAGYAEASAKQITNVMLSIRPHIEPVVQEMEDHRKEVMARMRETFSKATYGELVRSLDVTTRNIRLLTGKSTQNFAIDATVRAQLEQLLS